MNEDNPIAVIIPNYRMPERTDALVEHIQNTTNYPHKIFVVSMVDGAEDRVLHSKYATMECYVDLQMNRAITLGVKQAKGSEIIEDNRFFAYWFITTSMVFIDDKDIMSILAEKFIYDENAVQLSPALDKSSGTSWTNMITKGNQYRSWRKTFGMDCLATMYRADWFDSIGGYTPELTYGWGMDMEVSWKARRDDKTSWISEDCCMHKDLSVAYKMGRWDVTPEIRNTEGNKEADKVLGDKYGPMYIEKLMWEYATPDMGGL